MRGLLVAVAVAGAALAAASPARAGGLVLLDEHRIDARLVELTFRTPSLAGPTNVRVLLPAGYDAAQTHRYPVLLLLHGSNDDFSSWTRSDAGRAEQLSSGLPLITVMPSGGTDGWYTDWHNGGAGGPPRWERYHLDELLPWIDGRYRTVRGRAGHAVAGLSMGGFGALSYAARHPDRFVAAASFSGAVDTGQMHLPDALWGAGEVRRRAHNPWDLASNLRGVAVTLRTGNGAAGGAFGGGGPGDGLAGVEAMVHRQSVSLHARLTDLGIRHVWDDYGPGSHTWPYWNRDLQLTLPAMMAAFAHPGGPPKRVTLRAAERSFGAWGWRVAMHRHRLQFATLARAGASGFQLTGSGTATVTTPARYRPGRVYRVRVAGRAGPRAVRVRAGRRGRLRIAVPLGPARHPATAPFTTRVRVRR